MEYFLTLYYKMASVILQGTPVELAVSGGGGGGGGVASVAAGTYMANSGTASDVVLNSTLVAGDGIEISAGVLNSVSVNLAAGAGITITPPAGAGDPITIAASGGGGVTAVNGGLGVQVDATAPATPAVSLKFASSAAEFEMMNLNRTGGNNTGPFNFVAPYTGWFVFQPSLEMGQSGLTFPANGYVQFWIADSATPSVPDPNSLVCFTSASESPSTGLGILEDTRNALVYLTSGRTYIPNVQWGAGVDMGAGGGGAADGGAGVYMLPLFSA